MEYMIGTLKTGGNPGILQERNKSQRYAEVESNLRGRESMRRDSFKVKGQYPFLDYCVLGNFL
jgi:hypothetical protein